MRLCNGHSTRWKAYEYDRDGCTLHRLTTPLIIGYSICQHCHSFQSLLRSGSHLHFQDISSIKTDQNVRQNLVPVIYNIMTQNYHNVNAVIITAHLGHQNSCVDSYCNTQFFSTCYAAPLPPWTSGDCQRQSESVEEDRVGTSFSIEEKGYCGTGEEEKGKSPSGTRYNLFFCA